MRVSRLTSLALALALAGCPGKSPSSSTPSAAHVTTPSSANVRPSAMRTPTPTGAPQLGGGAFGTPAPSASASGTASSTPSTLAPSAAPSLGNNGQLVVSPLTHYAQLYDFDRIGNWVPGDVVDGALHVNRGPVGDAAGPVGATTPGRSRFHERDSHSGPFAAENGYTSPVFKGPVTLSYLPGVDVAPDASASSTPAPWFLADDGPVKGQVPWASVFLSPVNAFGLNNHPAPNFVKDEVPFPDPLVKRLAAVFGLPAGTDPDSLPWYGNLPDGLYVPTAALVNGQATSYAEGDAPAGGIYIRGTVEILRGAVVGNSSIYMFQVGYPHAISRVYVVRADRADHSLHLLALPSGTTLADALSAAGNDPLKLATTSGTPTHTLTDWSLQGADTLTLSLQGASAPFNGIIAVDLGLSDPLRDPSHPGHLLAPTATRRPLTGHILALGDPNPGTKLALGGEAAKLPAALAAAEMFSTEDASSSSGTPAATGLTIATAGSLFIQNHLVVAGIDRAIGAPRDLTTLVGSLNADHVLTAAVKDRLALWADRQVLVGLAAPNTPDKTLTSPGVVLTTSVIGLEDPGRSKAMRDGADYPTEDQGNYYIAGSFTTEGLLPYYLQQENYEIGIKQGGTVLYVPTDNANGYPPNPLYGMLGYDSLTNLSQSPNSPSARGSIVLLGSVICEKRGILGKGDSAYNKDFRFDARLESLPPPLVP